MSDSTYAQPTPRTDAEKRTSEKYDGEEIPGFDYVSAEFASDLETELTDATTALADARRALEEARAEWQDIATAPKDGTHVLINDGYSIVVAFWGESSVFVKEADAWCVGDCTGEYNIHQTISAPTHWRPLPTAP